MPDSEKIHRLFEKHDSFAKLLESVDSDKKAARLLTAVEGVGEEVETVVKPRTDRLDIRETGWARILWEAHNDLETEEISRTYD